MDYLEKFLTWLKYDGEFARESYQKNPHWQLYVKTLTRTLTEKYLKECAFYVKFNTAHDVFDEFIDFIKGNGFVVTSQDYEDHRMFYVRREGCGKSYN